MNDHQDGSEAVLTCPECKARLKRRRGRRTDACEMICGGCGHSFDVCDSTTRDRLVQGSQK
jgi:hypothetical protein